MEINHRSLLRGKRMPLCQAMDNDNVVQHLSKSNVLSTSDVETVKAATSNLKRNEKLLDILPKCGRQAFSVFLEALKQSKLVHLLGDEYVGKDDVNNTCNGKNTKLNEEKLPERNTSKRPSVEKTKMNEETEKNKPKHQNVKVDLQSYESYESYDIIDAPPTKEFLDVAEISSGNIVDVPHKDGYDMSTGDHQHGIKNNIASNTLEHGGEELLFYDSVDTPEVVASSNVSHMFPALTDHISSDRLMMNTDSTDSGGKDMTDSAPGSAASPEFEDGPFSLKRKEAPEQHKEAHEQADSSIPRTVIDESDCYPMKRTPRGYFLLINNKNFLPESTMAPYPRNGTDVDAAAMVALFQELGYVVDVHRNASCNQIRAAVKTLVNKDYSKVSAVACCFLSHGKEGVLYGTDGEINIKDITSYFREQKGLVGKPKMFFFQACQGSEYMDSVQPDVGTMEVDGPGGDVYGNDISLPTEADFIYAYSTVPGYYSWRNSIKGSWFIQGIVDVFRKNAHKMDVIRMLTRVNQIVSSKKSATGQYQSHNKRQICSIITQLRYELYLFPPHGPLKSYSP